MRILICGLLGLALSAPAAFATEVCSYSGQGTHSSVVSVTTSTNQVGSDTNIDVLATMSASFFLVGKINYDMEELSTWNKGQLVNVAVNTRSAHGSNISSESWDSFDKQSDNSFAGYEIKASSESDLQSNYPNFASHWPLDQFGVPWLQDFFQSNPQRVANLDLPASDVVPGLQTPLASAFYWVRYMNPVSQTIPVFIPGQSSSKEYVQVNATVNSDGNGGNTWTVPLQWGSVHSPSDQPAQIHVDGHHTLTQIDISLENSLAGVQGTVYLSGCKQQ